MSLSLSALTVIVLANVVVTIALWLESARRTPQFKLKKKFINQLLSFSSKPITPKHQPPKSESLNPNNQRFLDDFADFANIINARFEGWSAWRLQELPETEYRFFPVAPPPESRPELCSFLQSSGAGRRAYHRAQSLPR